MVKTFKVPRDGKEIITIGPKSMFHSPTWIHPRTLPTWHSLRRRSSSLAFTIHPTILHHEPAPSAKPRYLPSMRAREVFGLCPASLSSDFKIHATGPSTWSIPSLLWKDISYLHISSFPVTGVPGTPGRGIALVSKSYPLGSDRNGQRSLTLKLPCESMVCVKTMHPINGCSINRHANQWQLKERKGYPRGLTSFSRPWPAIVQSIFHCRVDLSKVTYSDAGPR